jgi:hypothetical protein
MCRSAHGEEAMMVGYLLIGIVLGLHFEVLILGPAISIAVLCVGLGGMIYEESERLIVQTIEATAVVLQLGYIVGVLARGSIREIACGPPNE